MRGAKFLFALLIAFVTGLQNQFHLPVVSQDGTGIAAVQELKNIYKDRYANCAESARRFVLRLLESKLAKENGPFRSRRRFLVLTQSLR